MGIYVNPGNRNFRDSLNSEVYVDKSEMVAELNRDFRTEQKYVCVSRARRFGKTMMTNLLSAYYSKGVRQPRAFREAQTVSQARLGCSPQRRQRHQGGHERGALRLLRQGRRREAASGFRGR